MTRYAKAKWTSDSNFDAETVARMHNGGPSMAGTDGYWAKIKNP